MSYSKFILLVFTLYLIYYVINIIYDSFFKKERKEEDNDNETTFVIGDEIPRNVIDDDLDIEEEKSERKSYTSEITESVEMPIETQGIPMEQLYEQGKSLFAGITY